MPRQSGKVAGGQIDGDRGENLQPRARFRAHDQYPSVPSGELVEQDGLKRTRTDRANL